MVCRWKKSPRERGPYHTNCCAASLRAGHAIGVEGRTPTKPCSGACPSARRNVRMTSHRCAHCYSRLRNNRTLRACRFQYDVFVFAAARLRMVSAVPFVVSREGRRFCNYGITRLTILIEFTAAKTLARSCGSQKSPARGRARRATKKKLRGLAARDAHQARQRAAEQPHRARHRHGGY